MTESFDKDVYDAAWNWFQVHADQRMSLFHFYILIVLAISAGYVGAVELKVPILQALLGLFGLLVSFVFYHLDRRVGSLIKLGEAVLKHEQEKASDRTGFEGFRLIESADTKVIYRGLFHPKRVLTYDFKYSELFRIMFAFVAFISLLGMLLPGIALLFWC